MSYAWGKTVHQLEILPKVLRLGCSPAKYLAFFAITKI